MKKTTDGPVLLSPIIGSLVDLPGQQCFNFPELDVTLMHRRTCIFIASRKPVRRTSTKNKRQVVYVGMGPAGPEFLEFIKDSGLIDPLVIGGVDKINVCYAPDFVILDYYRLLAFLYRQEME